MNWQREVGDLKSYEEDRGRLFPTVKEHKMFIVIVRPLTREIAGPKEMGGGKLFEHIEIYIFFDVYLTRCFEKRDLHARYTNGQAIITGSRELPKILTFLFTLTCVRAPVHIVTAQ